MVYEKVLYPLGFCKICNFVNFLFKPKLPYNILTSLVARAVLKFSSLVSGKFYQLL